MALVERLAILIDANSQGATREFKKLSGEAQRTDAQLTKTQKASSAVATGIKTLGVVAGGAAVAGLARFADASIDAASALEEARSKAQVVFGDQFSRIKTFAEDTANALNLSERAAFQFTAAFGQLFDSVGLSDQQTAEFSETLTTLAADIASFNDISVDEAFQKLRSGLSGEAEPLRQVGVFLSAAKVDAEAYSSGIAEAGEKLTEAEKIQARYNIILRETATAQGDVARTSESLANQQRNLAASTEDLQAQLGEDLAPLKADLLGVAAAVADLVGDFDDLFRVTGSSGGFYKNLSPLSVLMRILSGDIRDEFAAAAGDAKDSTSALDAELQRIADTTDKIGFRPLADDTNELEGATRKTLNEIARGVPVVDDFAAANNALLREVEPLVPVMDELPTPTRKYLDQVLVAAPATDDFAVATRGLLENIEPLPDEIGSTSAAAQEMGGQFAYVDSEASAASDALEALKDAVDELRSPALDLRDAQRDLVGATQDFRKSLKDNEATHLDQQAALDGIAEASFDVLNAYAETGASAGELRARTEELREKLIDAFLQFNDNETAAENYADRIGLIPDNVTTNVVLAGIDAAIEKAEKLAELTTGLSVSQLTTVARQDAALAGRPRTRASGGPVGPGTYLVGENGPELLALTAGTGRVFSNAQTMPMLSSNNSRNLTVNGNVVIQTPDPSRTWDQLNNLAVAQ